MLKILNYFSLGIAILVCLIIGLPLKFAPQKIDAKYKVDAKNQKIWDNYIKIWLNLTVSYSILSIIAFVSLLVFASDFLGNTLTTGLGIAIELIGFGVITFTMNNKIVKFIKKQEITKGEFVSKNIKK
jgi:hypothetical protein